MHNFVHIQIKVTDFKIAEKFYTNIFKWKVYSLPEMDNVLFYRVDDQNDQVGGAFFLVDKVPEESSILLYINADNVKEKLLEIEKLGGKIVLPATPLPGENGFIARFKDPFGNIMGLWSETRNGE